MQPQVSPQPKPTPRRVSVDLPETLYAFARQTLKETGNDADAAEAAMLDRLSEDKELLRALVSQAVKSAVGTTVAVILGNQRAASYNSAANIERAKIGARALAAGLSSALLDMPLADGTRLRYATKVDVTTDEISTLFGKPPNAVSGRLTELKRDGLLVKTDKRRKTRTGRYARVYVAVQR